MGCKELDIKLTLLPSITHTSNKWLDSNSVTAVLR